MSLSRLLPRFKGLPILVVGDSMLDGTVQGPADRLSPEAPVPIIRATEDRHAPGGAGNVSSNLAAFEARVTLLSVRGDDEEGEKLEEALRSRGVDGEHLLIDRTRPTISKTRIVAGHQQVARVDREAQGNLPAETVRALTNRLVRLVPQVKAIIISDYGKGVVNRSVVSACLKEAHRLGRIVTVDPKPEHFLHYRGVDCLTPNAKEAAEGMRSLPVKDQGTLENLGGRIVNRLQCRSCLITQGEKGMTLFERRRGARPVHIPTSAREVFDVTGAGDTVIALFTLARAAGASPVDAARLANAGAGVVVGKLGTAVLSPGELREAL